MLACIDHRRRHQIVDLRRQRVRAPARHRRGRLQRGAAGAHRQHIEQATSLGAELLEAPGHDLLHRGMARVVGRARAAAREQREGGVGLALGAGFEHALHLRQADAAHTRSGQLDRQRQALQQQHDARHAPVVGRGEAEAGACRACAVDEKRHGRVARVFLQAGVDGGQGQRGQRHLVLAVHRQGAARGHQQVQLGQLCQPVQQGLARGFDELLEVVEHEQHAPPCQRELDPRRGITAACTFAAQRAQHGFGHARSAGDASQRHEHHGVEGLYLVGTRPRHARAAFGTGPCHFHRQTCLAGPARAAQQHQAMAVHRRTQRGANLFVAKHARQVGRQPVPGWRPRLAHRHARWRRTPEHYRRQLAARSIVLQPRHRGVEQASFIDHPLVEMARQQLAPVKRGDARRVLLEHGLTQGLDVAAEGARCQAQHLAVGHQHGRGRRQRARWLEHGAQRRKSLAQPVAPDLAAGLGPEQVDQLFTRVVALRRQRQPRQDEHGRAAGQPVQYQVAVTELEAAEQTQVPACGDFARGLACGHALHPRNLRSSRSSRSWPQKISPSTT